MSDEKKMAVMLPRHVAEYYANEIRSGKGHYTRTVGEAAKEALAREAGPKCPVCGQNPCELDSDGRTPTRVVRAVEDKMKGPAAFSVADELFDEWTRVREPRSEQPLFDALIFRRACTIGVMFICWPEAEVGAPIITEGNRWWHLPNRRHFSNQWGANLRHSCFTNNSKREYTQLVEAIRTYADTLPGKYRVEE